MDMQPSAIVTGGAGSWNNVNRDPRGGVAEIQKMSPPTAVLSNKGVPQFWEMKHFLLQTYLH